MNLNPGDCESRKSFDEGVEISVGNLDNDGQWIPLLYVTQDLIERSKAIQDINIVPMDFNISSYISIRGYNVPILQQTGNSTSYINISVCGDDILRNGVQFRWLQTTSLFVQPTQYEVRDAWTMRDVYTTNPVCPFNDIISRLVLYNKSLVYIFINEFRRQISWSNGFRNSDFSTICSLRTRQLVFGSSCTTAGCSFNERQITASRIAKTVPLSTTVVSLGAASNSVVQLCPLEDPFGVHARALFAAAVRMELANVFTILMDLVSFHSLYIIIVSLVVCINQPPSLVYRLPEIQYWLLWLSW